MEHKITIHHVADYFILLNDESNSKSTGSEEILTHLKLQKLCYYAQAWHLAEKGYRLIDDTFEAWVHGPVCYNLYMRFNKHKPLKPITLKDKKITSFDEINSEHQEFINRVWQSYGIYTAKFLEQLTHQEQPWLEAREGLSTITASRNIIKDETMTSFYQSQDEKAES